MYPDSEILFPSRCIPQLRNLRGEKWAQLIDRLTSLPDPHEEVLGFSLMMIKLGSCLTCDLDSYRASLGCCVCARRTISGYKGSDDDLIGLFREAVAETRQRLARQDLPPGVAALIQKEPAHSGRK
jgi:hypothetical protein